MPVKDIAIIARGLQLAHGDQYGSGRLRSRHTG